MKAVLVDSLPPNEVPLLLLVETPHDNNTKEYERTVVPSTNIWISVEAILRVATLEERNELTQG